MDESLVAHIATVAALDEPARRRLYDYVVRRSDPVSRDEAAAALGMPRATAAFHLERLVEGGLLDVVYERRTGRSGPGAGRPAKLYHRSNREVVVSLPGRHYDLAGRLLAAALDEAERSGSSPRAVLDELAHRFGTEIAAASAAGGDGGRDAVMAVLDAYGFEPRVEDSDVVLGNCPFHSLAQEYTEMVCGMNLRLLQGLLDGFGRTDLHARLDPVSGQCCVRLDSA